MLLIPALEVCITTMYVLLMAENWKYKGEMASDGFMFIQGFFFTIWHLIWKLLGGGLPMYGWTHRHGWYKFTEKHIHRLEYKKCWNHTQVIHHFMLIELNCVVQD